MRACVRECVYLCVFVWVCSCVDVYIFVCVWVCVCVCVIVCACVHACVHCVCLCVCTNHRHHKFITTFGLLGYKNIISSSGVLVDLTPPSPGVIRNEAADNFTHDACKNYVPKLWQQRCAPETTHPTHR